MESADSRKRPQPRQQPSILTFFGPTPKKKRCHSSATDRGDIQPDITMNSTGHEEDVVASALDQTSRNVVVTEILPPSNTLTAEKGKEDLQSIATDIVRVIGLQNQEISPATKLHLIENHAPEADFNFPPRQYKDSTDKGGVRQQYTVPGTGFKCTISYATPNQQMDFFVCVVFFFLCQLIRGKGQSI